MVFTDADNTLWDTNKVYADAQLALLQHVESTIGERTTVKDRLAFLRDIDQDLALHHHAGLSYPPALLAIGLALRLKGMPARTAAKTALMQGQLALAALPASDIEHRFFVDLGKYADLRPGVFEGLNRLCNAGVSVAVITEGRKEKCVSLLEHHRLLPFIGRVVESKKTLDLYRRLGNLDGAQRTRSIMIGDQLDRDIAPAKLAGFLTIYFPGCFLPKWTPDENAVRPDYKVINFNEAVTIVLKINAEIREEERTQET